MRKSFEVLGVDEVIDSIRDIPTNLDAIPALTEAAEHFSSKVRDATPPGYSQKLPDSVMYEVSGDEAVVGYEEGVETAGNPRLDSVTRPRTRGKSVLRRWATVDDLATILEQSLDKHGDEVVSILERGLSNGLP